jgi:hypothetical protein
VDDYSQALHIGLFSMALTLTVVCVGILAVFALCMYTQLKPTSTSKLPLPPGPKGLPILGNINDLPKPGKLECHHWAQYKDHYGQCRIQSNTLTGS